MSAVRIAVVYYSATGNVHRLAEAFAEGAADEGAEVRLRRVEETAPEAAIAGNPSWREHLDATADLERVTLDDLTWADGLALGTPTRFGNVSAQLKQFLDGTGSLWSQGALVGKAVTGFMSSSESHGGQETTLMALYNTMCHWGTVIVPPGYSDFAIMHAAGGNPYGVSLVESQAEDAEYVKAVMAAARFQGGRLAKAAGALSVLREK